jgi:hypothetical protein
LIGSVAGSSTVDAAASSSTGAADEGIY